MYWCFISYRHADNQETDREWASWLHRAIEQYEVPAELIGTTNSRGEVIKDRIFPVFRDEDSLPADAHLGEKIREALDLSLYLVVICSPRSVESRYVNDEIRYFIGRGRQDRIVPAIIDGEPNDPSRECFPAPLKSRVDENGKVDLNAGPLAADFRIPGGREGYTSSEAYRSVLASAGTRLRNQERNRLAENYDKQLHREKLKIIAGILGVQLDVLQARDKAHQLALAQKRSRTLRQWLAAVGTMAVAALVSTFFAVEQRDEAMTQLAKGYDNTASQFLDQDRPDLAMPYLVASITTKPQPLTVWRLSSLFTDYSWPLPLDPPPFVSLAGTYGENLELNETLKHRRPSWAPYQIAHFSPGGLSILLSDRHGARIHHPETGEPLTPELFPFSQNIPLNLSTPIIQFSLDGRILAIGGEHSNTLFLDLADTRRPRIWRPSENSDGGNPFLEFSHEKFLRKTIEELQSCFPEEDLVVNFRSVADIARNSELAVTVGRGGYIHVLSVDGGRDFGKLELLDENDFPEDGQDTDVTSAAFSPDGSLLASTAKYGYLSVWKVDKKGWASGLGNRSPVFRKRLSWGYHKTKFSKCGKYIIAIEDAQGDEFVTIVDAHDMRQLWDREVVENVTDLAIDSERGLAAVLREHDCQIFDLATGFKITEPFPLPILPESEGYDRDLSIEFGPFGSDLWLRSRSSVVRDERTELVGVDDFVHLWNRGIDPSDTIPTWMKDFCAALSGWELDESGKHVKTEDRSGKLRYVESMISQRAGMRGDQWASLVQSIVGGSVLDSNSKDVSEPGFQNWIESQDFYRKGLFYLHRDLQFNPGKITDGYSSKDTESTIPFEELDTLKSLLSETDANLYTRAFIHQARGLHSEARTFWKRYLERHPQDRAAWRALAVNEIQRGSYQSAIDALENLLSQSSGESETIEGDGVDQFLLSILNRKIGNRDKADQILQSIDVDQLDSLKARALPLLEQVGGEVLYPE